MRSARFLTSGWRRGTQPASVSYSSGPSAILVLNPSSRCMPGESVSPSRGSGEAEGTREGELEPRRRRCGRRLLLLLPLPRYRPLCPHSPLRAGVPARVRASRAGPRAGARSAALRRTRRAEGSGRGQHSPGAGPRHEADVRHSPLEGGCQGGTESITRETWRRRGSKTQLRRRAAENWGLGQPRRPTPKSTLSRDPRDSFPETRGGTITRLQVQGFGLSGLNPNVHRSRRRQTHPFPLHSKRSSGNLCLRGRPEKHG